MMIWSFSGALALAAGIDDSVIGEAVAIGSVIGALTAIALMREQSIVPLPMTGLLCAVCLLAPLALTRPGAPTLFILALSLIHI